MPSWRLHPHSEYLAYVVCANHSTHGTVGLWYRWRMCEGLDRWSLQQQQPNVSVQVELKTKDVIQYLRCGAGAQRRKMSDSPVLRTAVLERLDVPTIPMRKGERTSIYRKFVCHKCRENSRCHPWLTIRKERTLAVPASIFERLDVATITTQEQQASASSLILFC